MTRRILRLVGVSVLLLGLAGALGLSAQEGGDQSPLKENEIYRLLQGKVSSQEVADMVRARGIDFEVTPQFEENLRTLKAKPVLFQAVKAPARLEIRANAAGAEVVVDGESRGALPAEGPLVVEDLGAGNHVVRVSSPDYVTKTETMFLKPGETFSLELTLTGAVSAVPEPLGIRVNVQAGTRPDATLREIEAADPTQKAQLIQQMIDGSSDSPLALLGYHLLQETNLAEKQYDQALAAGEKLLQRDPQNFSAHALQVRAFLGKGDLEEGLNQAQRLMQLLEQVRTMPAPEGWNPSAWDTEKERAFQEAGRVLPTLDYEMFVATNQAGDPAALERFLELFPESAYLKHAFVATTFAYQQQGNTAKMLEWGTRALEADPDQVSVLVVVTDALSEGGQDLERAEQLANQLLSLLTEQPEKARPEGLGDEQWAQQQKLWEGIAHSALGQVFLHQNKGPAAIKEFRTGMPLLKDQPQYYARNLWRLGHTYAGLGGRGNMEQARRVLSELIQFGTAFAPPARELLSKVEAALAPKKKK